MKSNEFVFTEVGDDVIAVPVGETSLKFKGIIRMNDTAAFIIEQYLDGVSEEKIAEIIVKNYASVDYDTAISSVKTTIHDLKKEGILE